MYKHCAINRKLVCPLQKNRNHTKLELRLSYLYVYVLDLKCVHVVHHVYVTFNSKNILNSVCHESINNIKGDHFYFKERRKKIELIFPLIPFDIIVIDPLYIGFGAQTKQKFVARRLCKKKK